MTRIIIIAVLATVGFIAQNLNAQDIKTIEKIEQLESRKKDVVAKEKDALKKQVERINEQLDNNEITLEQANIRKQEAAEKHARNIEDQIAIIDGQIALYKRNDGGYEYVDENNSVFRLVFGLEGRQGKDGDDGTIYIGKRYRDGIPYDRRTTSDLVVAIGLNNAIIEGRSLNDSPYKVAGSRFFELGWAWKTRVFDESNWLRFKYGFSFQFNGLNIDDNQYFVENGEQTQLETFPLNLDKAKFRMDNLVFPVHFEIGGSERRDYDDHFRYDTSGKFKLGLGGYAGLNLLTIQKLKYGQDGNDRKDKFKQNYNTNNFIYGLSGYVAIDDVALYVKYDLNTIFKDNALEQRNVSVGLRFDLD